MKDLEYEKILLQSKLDYMTEYNERIPQDFELVFELGWDAKENFTLRNTPSTELAYSVEEYFFEDSIIIPHNLNTPFDMLDWKITPIEETEALSFSLIPIGSNHQVMLKILDISGVPFIGTVILKIEIKKRNAIDF